MTTYHVATTGSDTAAGTEQAPFRTINHAAQVALPGDTVLVHEGTYREWVQPKNAGLSENRRITYAAAPGEHAVIKGSEQITTWEHGSGNVWKVTLDNAMFGDWNPYAVELEGDWVVRRSQDEPRMHLGDVYLDGMSFYEVLSRDAVTDPKPRETVMDHWTGQVVRVDDVNQTTHVWYAEVSDDTTTIWANFQGANPNESLVEINVRRSVFYPTAHHINYITVRGFELAQCASPWTPPTADQPGLIGPNWAKGWIIEDNDIHDAKCSAVSLGKEASTGHNNFTNRRDKPGYQYQLESVFAARQIGWTKELIGSHIVRNNHIHHCGQNAIVGHLGCVFSDIYGNDIHHIATKREYFGHEIAGIKLHAAIDTVIERNHIHHCTLGVWLDWQTQGTRVSSNVMHDNCRDLFVEVSHGPHVVDHNVLASPAAIESFSQGGAYVNNLVGGAVRIQSVMDRATPYHYPHSTEVSGYAVIYAGDDRWVGNIFVGHGGDASDDEAAYPDGALGKPFAEITKIGYGTAMYDGHPTSWDEWVETIKASLPGDHAIFPGKKQPVWMRSNVYLYGATAFDREEGALVEAGDPAIAVTNGENGVELTLTLPDSFGSHSVAVPTTADLGRVRFPDAEFEARDGGPIDLGKDLVGATKPATGVAGPLAALKGGKQTIKVW